MNTAEEEKLYHKYYGSNYSKAMANLKKGNAETKADFLKKYPHADLSKFNFTTTINQDGNIEKTDTWFVNSDIVSTNIDSDTFRNDHTMTKYLTNYKGEQKPSSVKQNNGNFPKIWLSNGTIQKIPKGHGHFYTRFGERQGYYDGFPAYDILNYPINNFRVYINSKDYFMSKLPELKISFPGKPFVWNDPGSYFRTVFAVYLSTFCCGVALQHLTPEDDIYPVITSIMRFHLYFTVRRLLKRLQKNESMYSLSKEFQGQNLYRVILKLPWDFSYEPTVEDGVKGVKNINVVKENYKTHYKRYVPKVSNGLTEIGLQYLNQSVEAYIYAVLGSQAKTRVSIINHGGGSLETQQEFRTLVEDAVVNYSVSTWILNMNKSISDTFVKQDLAISSKTWLVPSKMVILKKTVKGYNNLLKTASDTMTFGVNDINKINVKKIKASPKKEHTPDKSFIEVTKTHKSESKPKKEHTPAKSFTEIIPQKKSTESKPIKMATMKSTTQQQNTGPILIAAIICGVLISKYKILSLV